MTLEGYISKIIYSNEENSYSVFVVETHEGDEIFVGSIPGIAEGMFISAEGEYVHHPQYDLQFKVASCELSFPDDSEGLIRFLGSGMIKGVGEALARRIVNKFRDDTIRIIDEEPERLKEVKGISERMAESIAVEYSKNKNYRNVVTLLSRYGISVKMAMKIYEVFGDHTPQIIKTNPYLIADEIPGIGFKTADSLAMRAGIEPDSRFRVKSAILYVLTQAETMGHMYLPENWIVNNAADLLGVWNDQVDPAPPEDFANEINDILVEMAMDKKVVMKKTSDGPIVYLSWNHHVELASARLLFDLKTDYETPAEEIEDAIKEVEEAEKIQLEDMQKEAVKHAISEGVAVITGGPGTGKTTIINAIMKYYEMNCKEVLLAAPTGRAAKRITESTGYQAKTIHRLLEFNGEPDDEGYTRPKFQRNEENPLETDAVIIDEASMIDSNLFFSLLKAIQPGTRLVLVGDTDQLPPVGAGNVLRDIIDSAAFSVTVLDRIFRQGSDSAIVSNAHKIKNGEHISLDNDSSDFFFIPMNNASQIQARVADLVTVKLPKYLKIAPEDIQILTPMRKYELGVETLNKRLQNEMNPPAPTKREKEFGDVVFREGDKVMQIKNDYKIEWRIEEGKNLMDEGIGVFNGDMGIIMMINDFDNTVTIRFDDGRIAEYPYSMLNEIEHAFAITVHKSQGSEYPAVIVPIFNGPDVLYNRNLLYTAVTRAKRMVVLIGNMNRVNQMIDNVNQNKRFTSFADRIREMSNL